MVKLKSLSIFFTIFTFLFLLGCVINYTGLYNNIDLNDDEKLNPITEDCISWFDGCNYCSLEDDGVLCTERACIDEKISEPYCIMYASN